MFWILLVAVIPGEMTPSQVPTLYRDVQGQPEVLAQGSVAMIDPSICFMYPKFIASNFCLVLSGECQP